MEQKFEEEIKEAVQQIQKDIQEQQDLLQLVQSIDWSAPVDEDTWHKLCLTSLCYGQLLSVFVKNIFPNAENVKMNSNEASFELYECRCYIPTHFGKCVYIDMSWYQEYYLANSKPILDNYMNSSDRRIKQYFALIDKNCTDWKELYKYIASEYDLSYRKWVQFILWNFKYRWQKPKYEKWEERKEQINKNFIAACTKYEKIEHETNEKMQIIYTKVIPELERFSKSICVYRSSGMTWEFIDKFEKRFAESQRNRDQRYHECDKCVS